MRRRARCSSGTRPVIERAQRARKILGGAMRQAGIVAAAGLYALEHHVERLAEDHANAERLAAGLAGVRGLEVEPPQTNMVFVRIPADRAAALKAHLERAGRPRPHRAADAARHASRRLGAGDRPRGRRVPGVLRLSARADPAASDAAHHLEHPMGPRRRRRRRSDADHPRLPRAGRRRRALLPGGRAQLSRARRERGPRLVRRARRRAARMDGGGGHGRRHARDRRRSAGSSASSSSPGGR